MKRVAYLSALTCILFSLSLIHAQTRSVESAFEKFWAAATPDEAAKAGAEIVTSGVPFDEALRRLKAGRMYQTKPSGVVLLSNKTKDGVEHHYAVNVPANYDSGKRYQVRF